MRLKQAGQFAVIEVQDTGRGISREDQKKIFQLFFTTRPGGSGIGLANTFRFVQLHDGRIEFESEPGKGTTFRVELPLARVAATQTERAAELSGPVTAEKT